MSSHLVGWNVVVVARQFNPSVMSQIWLVKNGMMTEADFADNFLFSDSLVQIQNPDFNLIFSPEQLQFQPKGEKAQEQHLIEEKVGAIVRKLPETPYAGVGLNFFWHITPDLSGVRDLSRKLFFRSDSDLYREFDSEDAKFGSYLSKDFMGCRLKLDIKPIQVTIKGTEKESIVFNFNYHLDLAESEDAIEQICSMLGKWDEAKLASAKLVKTAEAEDFR